MKLWNQTLKVFCILLLSQNIHADNFKVGSGARYLLEMKNGAKADLKIYISESSFSKLGVEYEMRGQSVLSSALWQQFTFKLEANSPLIIDAGYVKTEDMKFPESLSSEYLNVNKGVKVQDFIFKDFKSINKYKVKNELIEVPAGNIVTTHYRKKRGGQTIDFWVSNETKPIGLVKLISTSKDSVDNNYKIVLQSLIKNKAKAIDPQKAKPLSEIGKKYLATPLKNHE